MPVFEMLRSTMSTKGQPKKIASIARVIASPRCRRTAAAAELLLMRGIAFRTLLSGNVDRAHTVSGLWARRESGAQHLVAEAPIPPFAEAPVSTIRPACRDAAPREL